MKRGNWSQATGPESTHLLNSYSVNRARLACTGSILDSLSGRSKDGSDQGSCYVERVLTGDWVYPATLAASFTVATVASPSGISGAVLLLPFQLGVLGTAQPVSDAHETSSCRWVHRVAG
jgi:hypothetical protein